MSGAFSGGQPGLELGIVAQHLAEGGSFHLIYQPLVPDTASETAGALSAKLNEHGFTVDSVLVEDLEAATAVCVIAMKESAGEAAQSRSLECCARSSTREGAQDYEARDRNRPPGQGE